MRTRSVTTAVALGTACVVAVSIADPRAVVTAAAGTNLVIQTTVALVALLVALVAIGRFRLRRRAADLFLVLALVQLAASNLLFTVLPLAGNDPVSSRTEWAGVLTRLGGVLLLVAAAHARLRHVERTRHAFTDGVGIAGSTLAVLAVGYAAAARLPEVATGDPAHRLWDTAPGHAAVLAVIALASAVAAAGFARDAVREPEDQLFPWLAVAAVVLAGANATSAGTFVSTSTEYVSSADVLRLTS